jgi:hypothetical protein
LDRLALRRSERGTRRSEESYQLALDRLRTLLHHCGGIYFGDDLAAQLRLCQARGWERELRTLRFSCQGWCFAFLREGLRRYPIEHTRLSRPLPGDTWWHHPKAPHVLEPGSAADSHPYPVELDLPSWTVAADVDLRTWLFGFGAGIRIEQPAELRQEHQERLQAALAVYAPSGSGPLPPPFHPPAPTPGAAGDPAAAGERPGLGRLPAGQDGGGIG